MLHLPRFIAELNSPTGLHFFPWSSAVFSNTALKWTPFAYLITGREHSVYNISIVHVGDIRATSAQRSPSRMLWLQVLWQDPVRCYMLLYVLPVYDNDSIYNDLHMLQDHIGLYNTTCTLF